MVYSEYVRQRVLMFRELGLGPPTINKMLDREAICVHRTGIHSYLKKSEETGTVARNVGSGRPSKITPAIKSIIDEQMERGPRDVCRPTVRAAPCQRRSTLPVHHSSVSLGPWLDV